MNTIQSFFAKRNSILIAIGFIYFWFGILKFFPETSAADSIAKDTISALCMNIIPTGVTIILLAIAEVSIGLLLIFQKKPKIVIYIALGHLFFTFTPLLVFQELSFGSSPFIPTLLGQYILKNIILIVALLQGLRFRGSILKQTLPVA